MKVTKVKIHDGNLRTQVMKSDGLVSLLESEAQAAAARCNAQADKRITGAMRSEPYGGFASIHRNTAVGVVATRGWSGKRDDAVHNTLKSATGW